MMTNIEIFNEIEKKYNLYEDTIEECNYWMYSRFDIWNYILSVQNHSLGKTQNQPEGIKSKLKTGIELIKTMIFGRKIQKRDIDIVFLIHERKVMIDGVYECKYTEEIRSFYDNSYAFERLYERGHLKPTNTKNLIYLDKVALQGKLYYCGRFFLRQRYRELIKIIEQKIVLPVKELEEYFQISFDIEYIVQVIAKQVLIYKGKHKAYERIFHMIHPKLIIELVYYNMDSMIINEIAKREGIRTVELQHGNIYNSHVSYQYNTKSKIKQLPDEIWLLSEYWRSVVNVPLEDKYLVPVGFPYLEKQICWYKKNFQKQERVKTILFLSQGTIGKQLSEFAVDFVEHYMDDGYRVIYKLHPGEISIWKEKYVELSSCEKIEVIDNRDIDLYRLFVQSDIQVGVYSTAIYEGIGFGLDTYICDLPYAEEMEKLYQDGYAEFVRNPEELMKKVRNKMASNNLNKEFWTSDSISKIKKRIDDILIETKM